MARVPSPKLDFLRRVDEYFDAAPRPDSDAFVVGPFTLFVSRTPWSYYARPSLGLGESITVADLDDLGAACREHGVDLAIEWVHDLHPALADVAAAYGLGVSSYALMAAFATDVIAPEVGDVALRVVEPDDRALLAARAVADVAFGVGGTAIGREGAIERNQREATLDGELAAHLRSRAERGLTVTAVAETLRDGVVAVASCQPMGELAEVVGVATLPSSRRRGLAGALVATLARRAVASGVDAIVLSAENDDVADVYARVGFRRVATACAAEFIE